MDASDLITTAITLREHHMVDQSIHKRDIPISSARYEVAILFGTLVAETILASVHVCERTNRPDIWMQAI